MSTTYGVYQTIEGEPYESPDEEVLVAQFATEEMAKQFIADYPMLAYRASSDDDGWLIRFWSDHRDEVVAVYGEIAAGKVGRIPKYVIDNAHWGKTPEEQRAKYREQTMRDAQGHIDYANHTVSKVKETSTKARKAGEKVWIKRHFPKGADLFIKPVEVLDRPVVYSDIRYTNDAEQYLRGHNEG